MYNRLKLPVGIENFEEIRKEGFYYIDKTKLIEQLLLTWGKVNLFTRPRRFGKTLNMSMFKSFFEIGTDKKIFDGLYISGNKKLCDEYMGKYPVIFISFKDINGLTYDEAFDALVQQIGAMASCSSFLLQSDKLIDVEKEQYRGLINIKDGKYHMDKGVVISSLRVMSQLLNKHYGKKTIVIIDEYDVPLDKAFSHDYYDQMTELIRGLLGQALKTNDYLKFAIVTGCLRVSKESIFTGINNFKVLSILDTRFDEQFGFTDDEVRKILNDYGLSSHFEEIKAWYDGYRFGSTEVYCPWDVINYIDLLMDDENAMPQDFWSNSSGNSIVRRFIEKANIQTKSEIESLISGESIEKSIEQELTYNEIDKKIDNLWSVLFTTGYLTHNGRTKDGKYKLIIPNREIHNLFIKQIREWFDGVTKSDGKKLDGFCNAFLDKEPEKIGQLFRDYLWNTISIRDTAVAKDKKENFYHGILLGLFGYKDNWLVKSNAESGIGYSDILIEVPDNRTGIVVELKYAEDGDLETSCEKALRQIAKKDYVARLRQDGMKNYIKYGIACYKKDCKVMIDG